jgi:WD40 repeat protein
MSSTRPFTSGQCSNTQDPVSFESLVSSFERLWLQGKKPSIDNALQLNAGDRQTLLIELVHAELELRLKAGEPARVEEYVARYPGLTQDRAAEWGLIVAEYTQRARGEPGLALAEYQRRFPHLHTELAQWRLAQKSENTGAVSRPSRLVPERGPPSAPPAQWLALPGLKVHEELGRGGMGIIYKAWQVSLMRLVAVKVLRPGAAPEERVRFRTEAEAAARLRHPHIVQIHEVGEHIGQSYLVMEYAPGGSLARRLDGTPWPASDAAELVRVLAEGVQHAHSHGVLHRDLTPGNVLLDADGRPKVADFGLAKLVVGASAEQTRTVAVLGTPSYMSPEQAAGKTKQVGPVTDVYGLGAILYELLTGRPPFHGQSPLDTIQQVITEALVPPRRLNSKVPRDLETICLTALEKKPSDRYPSAVELAADLRRFLGGESIRAQPPSAWRRAVLWARRRPSTAALSLAGIVGLAAVIAGLSWHAAELSAALDDAQREWSRANANEQRLTIALEDTQREKLKANANALRARQSEYASQIGVAYQRLRLGEPFVVASLLDAFRPTSPEAEDLRAFEWWYLTRYRQPAPKIFLSHQGYITQVAYSPDGRLLATACDDGDKSAVKVWDTRAAKLKFSVPLEHYAASHGPPMVFGPGDSGWLAVCTGDAVTRWDLRAGMPLPGRLVLPEGTRGVAAHPDGRRLIVSGKPALSVWDADKCTHLRTFPDASRDAERLCISADGNTLATVRSGAPLRLWDLNTGTLRSERPSGNGIDGLVAFPRSPFLVHSVGFRPEVIPDSGSQALSWDWGDDLEASFNAVAISPGEEIMATSHASGFVRFWDVSTRSFCAQLRWQGSPITCLSFSPDGTTLAVGTRAGTVFLVNPPERQVPDLLRPALVVSSDIAFTPDGKSMAVGASDRTVKLIDLGSGEARTILKGFLNAVAFLAFSHDGGTIATRELGSGGVRLWDVATGTSTGMHQGNGCFVFSPSDCMLAIGHDGIALIDRAGVSRGAVRSGQEIPVALAFSRDGRTLVSVDGKDTVEFWDVSGGRLAPAASLRQHLEGAIQALAILPDGTLVTGEKSGWVRFWERAGGKLTPVRTPLPCSQPVTRLEVSRDGQTLLTHGVNQNVRCWNLKSLKLRDTLFHYTGVGIRTALSPDGDKVAIAGRDGRLELWDCKTTTLRLLAGAPLWTVRALAFTPNGQTLITAGRVPERKNRGLLFGAQSDTCAQQPVASTLRYWGSADGQELAGPDGPLTMAPPDLVALAPDGRTLAAGGLDGSIWLWDLREGGPPCRRLFVSLKAKDYINWFEKLRANNIGNPIYPEALSSVAFSANGQRLAAAGTKGTVKVWDCGDYTEVCSLSLDPAGPVWVAFSPAGNLVVPVGGQIRFLDGSAESFTLGRKDDSAASCMAFTMLGNRVAVAHQDQLIRLWDLATRESVGDLIGHLDQINALAFSPDGKTLASAGRDSTVKLWSVPAAAEVASLQQHRGPIFCLAFSPDGTTLASGGDKVGQQGEVYLWRARRP